MRGQRTALVTGGSGGIGLAVGERLVGAGYDVVLTARDPDRLASAASSIGARSIAADATDEDAMAAVVEHVGQVDLLVHSAGVFGAMAVRKQSVEEFRRLVELNLIGAYVVSRACVENMTAGGRMILVSSISGIDGHPWLSAYASAKAGVRMLGQVLRDEAEKDGVSVHVLTLPTVDTPMMASIERPAILAEDCAHTVLWLDSMNPRVRIPEVVLRAADASPFVHYTRSSDGD